MTIGNTIRILLVLAWVGLFTTHALHYALPDLGLVQRHDLAAIIKANVGNSFLYSIQTASSGNPGSTRRTMGTCTLSLEQVERGFQFSTHLLLTDPTITQALQLLLAKGSDASSDAPAGVSLDLSEDYDDHFLLYGLRAEAHAAGHLLIATGKVGAEGFAGFYRLDRKMTVPLLLPEITPQTGQGVGMAVFLPAGLRRGDKFSQSIMVPDLLQRSTHRSIAVFTVQGSEPVPTSAQDMTLLHVDMAVDGKLDSTFWCDASGTIYRALKPQSQILLLLQSKREIEGERRILWPPPAAANAPQPPASSGTR